MGFDAIYIPKVNTLEDGNGDSVRLITLAIPDWPPPPSPPPSISADIVLPLLLPLSLYRDPRFHGYYVRVPLRISVLATTIFHFIPKPSSLHSVQRVTEIRTLNILPAASPCAEKLRQSDSRKRFRNDGKILNWKIGSSRFAGDVIQIQISLGRRSVGSVYIQDLESNAR